MNIHVTARTFTSGSDILRSAAALNARLHRPAREFVCVRPPVKVAEPETDLTPEPPPVVEPEPHDADWHIRAYAYWLARVDDGDARQHVIDRCELWGIQLEDIVAPSQQGAHSEARSQLAWEIAAHINPDETLCSIGEILGGRNHSTIRQIIARHEKRMRR